MNFTNKNIPIIILAGGKGERFVTKENDYRYIFISKIH